MKGENDIKDFAIFNNGDYKIIVEIDKKNKKILYPVLLLEKNSETQDKSLTLLDNSELDVTEYDCSLEINIDSLDKTPLLFNNESDEVLERVQEKMQCKGDIYENEESAININWRFTCNNTGG